MDQQWFAWHQLAMRRFLLCPPQTTSISNSWLPGGMQSQVEPTSATDRSQDLYWPQDSSLVTESTTTFEGMNTLFEACSKTVALEGDPWELSNVSKVTQVKAYSYPNTNRRIRSTQDQEDNDMFGSLYGDKVTMRCPHVLCREQHPLSYQL
jgi:hypothetical protein